MFALLAHPIPSGKLLYHCCPGESPCMTHFFLPQPLEQMIDPIWFSHCTNKVSKQQKTLPSSHLLLLPTLRFSAGTLLSVGDLSHFVLWAHFLYSYTFFISMLSLSLFYLCIAVLGIHCCPRAFLIAERQGYLSLMQRASHGSGFSCGGAQAPQ